MLISANRYKDSYRCIKASLLCVLLQNGCSPVCAASEKGHTEVVDLLVSAEADIHKATTTVSTLPILAVYNQYIYWCNRVAVFPWRWLLKKDMLR